MRRRAAPAGDRSARWRWAKRRPGRTAARLVCGVDYILAWIVNGCTKCIVTRVRIGDGIGNSCGRAVVERDDDFV